MAQITEGSRLAGRQMIPDYNSAATSVGNNGIYTVVTYTRPDGTKYLVSTLTNPDSNGYYTTDTWTFYDASGNVVTETHVWTLAWDSNGKRTSAVMS